MLRQSVAVLETAMSRGIIFKGLPKFNVAWRIPTRSLSYRSPPRALPWSARIGTEWQAQPWRSNVLSRLREGKEAMNKQHTPFARRNFHSSRPYKSNGRAGESAKESAEPQSFSARMRKLSREYGWAAVGVYAGLSVLDLPFCFLLVRTIGTDRIAAAEHYIVSKVQVIIPQRLKDFWHEYRKALKDAEVGEVGNNNISNEVEMVGWGVKEADERNQEEASLATQFALAYAIHKSFIFVRVPLAAAVTPRVVKQLRSWGWQIGKKRPKA